MILAVGTDLVLVDRFARSLERSPSLVHRVFSIRELSLLGLDAEQQLPGNLPPSRAASLAARFAAKEAVLKALGTIEAGADIARRSEHAQGWRYSEIEVLSPLGTPPRLELNGATATYAAQLAEASFEAAKGVGSVGHGDALAGELAKSEERTETGHLTVADRAQVVQGASRSASEIIWHLSLAHDGGMALAFVVASMKEVS